MKKVPLIMQMNSGENGAATLSMFLAYYRKFVPMDEVRDKCVSSRNATTIPQLCRAAEYYHLETECTDNVDIAGLRAMQLPVAAQWNKKYFVIICAVGRKTITVNDAAKGTYSMTVEAFLKRFTGSVIQLRPGEGFVRGGKPTGMIKIVTDRMRGSGSVIWKIITLRGFEVAATIITLLLSRNIIDEIMGNDDREHLVVITALFALCILARIVFSIMEVLFALRKSRDMTAKSASGLYQTILRQPISFFEKHFSGDLVYRMDTNTSLGYSILQNIIPKMIDCVVAVVYAVLMFFYNYHIASIIVFIEIVNVIAYAILKRKTAVTSKSISVAESAANSRTMQGMDMIETIKTSGVEQEYFRSWSETQDAFDEGKYKMIHLNSIGTLISGLHSTISSAVLLFVGAYFIMKGSFTIGILSMYMTVVRNMQSNVNQMTQVVGDLQMIRYDIERVDDIINRDVEEERELGNEEPEKLKGQISLKDITFAYSENDPPTISGYSLEIAKGEKVALVGHTGCGKSTILKILSGLYKPQGGQVLYDGREYDDIPSAIVHSSIASVGQDTVMFVDSIENNIKLWDEFIEDYEVILAAKDAYVHNVITDNHEGYSSVIAEHGKNFSGGELQRIELARALAMDPTVLILDEFTSALDAITEEKVFKSIMDRGITCVMAAHRLSTVMLCDRVLVMDHGEIVEQGSPDELYKLGGRFTKLMENI